MGKVVRALRLQKFILKKVENITYKYFRICIHHVNIYHSSLLTLHNYKAGTCVHHTKDYQDDNYMDTCNT